MAATSTSSGRTSLQPPIPEEAIMPGKFAGQETHNALVSEIHSGIDDAPTAEELKTLRRVSGKINWTIYTIAFIELCERFSYYGSAVLYSNFINKPLPPGSTTGAPLDPSGQAGALGMGPQAAQAMSLVNSFFAYLTPLLGAYVADARLGRYWTLHIAIAIATVAHVILVAASAPTVIVRPNAAFGAFIVGLLTLCVGAGFFKANVSPLLGEQNTDNRMRVEVAKDGQRVIVDPAITNTRIFLYFYLCINIGTLLGQIGMVYVEKYVGFWFAFLIPTLLFLVTPFVMIYNKKRYVLLKPSESVLSKFFRVLVYVQRRCKPFRLDLDVARPSRIPAAERPSWMTYDDAWIDEIKRGLAACRVFMFLPIFFLAFGQMTGNLTAQAATMELHGTPNDVIQSLNPITIIVIIPILDFIYSRLRRIGFIFTPIKRIACGFLLASLAMVASAVMQYNIYEKGECGWYANRDGCPPAPINAWAQCLPYILIGIAEVFTNATAYEYAYSKAPPNMRSMVTSVKLFTNAFSSALGQAFTPLSRDPLFVWNYTVIAVIAFIGGGVFWVLFRKLDADEDRLNLLEKSEYACNDQSVTVAQGASEDQGKKDAV